jgi:hypothetical protein
MASARAVEYAGVLEQATAATILPRDEQARVVGLLRGELRRIRRRDFFPPAERDAAVAAVNALAAQSSVEDLSVSAAAGAADLDGGRGR